MGTWVEARTASLWPSEMGSDQQRPAQRAYSRLFVGPDGASHFGKELIRFRPSAVSSAAPPVLSATTAATQCTFLLLPGGFDGGWQPAPARQFVFFFTGTTELKAGDGAVHRYLAGSVVLLEDTAGRGHRTRVVSAEPALLAVVRLSD